MSWRRSAWSYPASFRRKRFCRIGRAFSHPASIRWQDQSMSEFRGKPDQTADPTGTGISFATWQDRQLSVILARTDQLLRELRAAAASVDGRNEELSRELGRATALLEVREGELRKSTRQ